ncbi:PaaI family thioesterase [Sphingomonas canadensis]|uniref:PaaI family thioesterase n=1 Tax=Sphingomonas canadensis TaxID=1219257 RepID=A0ABW3H5U5_9SPHN|nr:PaaI family thioesterase [Sphingomonas canadensis]MCW3835323.1 PaaI family thioesterase [Sphingomonas canadensis]
MNPEPPKIVYEDDPGTPGWKRWSLPDPTLFNAFLGPILVKVEDGIARVRMQPAPRHANLRGHVHGGALSGFIDVALFAASRGFGVLQFGTAATLDLSIQFIAGASIERPVEARVELLRETGRLLFLRGLIVQDDATVASFSGTVRKPSPAAA